MKRTGFMIAGAFVLCLALSTGAAAKMGEGSGGWGMGSNYSGMYDTARVETLSGEVLSVDEFKPMKGMSKGIHLTLKTEKETIPVHLGPEWFLEKQETTIEKGNILEVTGSRVSFDGKHAIIAAEVTKDGQTLKLRDANGVPAWSGWRKQQ